VKLHLIGSLALSAALFLAGPTAAEAQPAASAPESGMAASDVASLPVLAKEPEEGHLRPGQQVLVDDGSCAAGQIKEVTGGTNRKCTADVELLDPSKCPPVTGSKRTSRCIARP
jgi:hypothetical protein